MHASTQNPQGRPVSEAMSARLVLVEAEAPAASARALAEERGVHHLIVVRDGEFVGVTCLCDLAQAKQRDSVERCTHAPAVCVGEHESAEKAASLMRECGVGCLPVVSADGLLCGIVTRRDLRRNGTLPGELGVDRCAHCGTTHHLRPASRLPGPVLCFACAVEVSQ
jgi:acetoin utilization protein AcuB